jgi:hypothetical protein
MGFRVSANAPVATSLLLVGALGQELRAREEELAQP